MAGLTSRLDKLYPGLSALERARLVLRAFKEDGEDPKDVRRSMPAHQVGEFNEYIGLMNAVNGHFGLFISILGLLVNELETRYTWLITLKAWGMHATMLEEHLGFMMKEPVTEREHRKLMEKARRRTAPVVELAEVLVDHEEEEGEEVTDESYERVLAEKEREIAALVESGRLQGKGSGRRLRVNVGSFYDWLGEPVPVRSKSGSRYEVVPDHMGGMVEEQRRWRSEFRRSLRRAPLRFAEGMAAEETEEGNGEERGWDEVARGLAADLRRRIAVRWQELLAAETILGEAREEFGGEEVLQPGVWQELEEAKAKLNELAQDMERYGGPVELPEPTEKQTDDARTILERARAVF